MDKLKILLAKGRIYESVYELLSDVGILSIFQTALISLQQIRKILLFRL